MAEVGRLQAAVLEAQLLVTAVFVNGCAWRGLSCGLVKDGWAPWVQVGR